MKFFEVCNQFFNYALVSAENVDEAVQLYIAEVFEVIEENSEFEGKIIEISRDHALIMYSRIPGEDGKLFSIEDTIQNINSDPRKVILMDRSPI